MQSRLNSGKTLIGIYLTIPTLLWILSNTPSITATTDLWSVAGVLGRFAALWGLLLLFLNFILATRARLLDSLFKGLNNVYILHHIIGGLSLIFLLFHPMLSIGQYIGISLPVALSFISFNPPNVPVLYGIIALDLMIILLILTFFVSLKYEIWKKSHKLLGVVLIPAGLHVLQISPSIQASPILKYYLYFFWGVAVFAYLYKSIFWKYLTPYYDYKVTSVRVLNNTATEVIMKPIAKKMNFTAGQFVFVRFKCEGILDEEHPFSITSNDDGNTISLCIKDSGDFTKTLSKLKNGSVAKVQGPFGTFSTNYYSNDKQIWIAGGIGITPFLSMARSLNGKKDITLYYVVSNKSDALYSNELLRLAKSNPHLTVHVYSKNDIGKRITATHINKEVDYTPHADVFVCGPAPMMKALRKQFKDLGLKGSQIHTEEFALN